MMLPNIVEEEHIGKTKYFQQKKILIDSILDLEKYEHRYNSVRDQMTQFQSYTNGFLITGHLDERNFYEKWQDKVICIILSKENLS